MDPLGHEGCIGLSFVFNAFLSRALGAVGLMRIDLAAEQLVPAGTTWSQILDYASGSSGFDFDQAGLPISRNTAVSATRLSTVASR